MFQTWKIHSVIVLGLPLGVLGKVTIMFVVISMGNYRIFYKEQSGNSSQI
jgi:hypothetical protein